MEIARPRQARRRGGLNLLWRSSYLYITLSLLVLVCIYFRLPTPMPNFHYRKMGKGDFNTSPSKNWSEEVKNAYGSNRNTQRLLWFKPKHIKSVNLHSSCRELISGIHRNPRLAIILGKLDRHPFSMKMFTVAKSLKELQYTLKIFAMKEGAARPDWEQLGGKVTILSPKSSGLTDWSIFEGVIASSLEAKKVIPSLLQDPFCSIPLIWIIEEDTLVDRFPFYVEMGFEDIIAEWRNSFNRANAIVFSCFALPMLYNKLDDGNFFVIPGSPIDAWSAENYLKSHYSRRRAERHLVIVIVGSTFFYENSSLESAFEFEVIRFLRMEFTRADESSKIIFLCGSSTGRYNEALLEVALILGLPRGSVMHYGLDSDVNHILLEADVVVHGSFQDEQGFPPLLLRAMSFGALIVAPDLPIIKKYIVDGLHGLLYEKHNLDKLKQDFSLLVSGRGLSRHAQNIAAFGKLHSKNMLASECVTGYAQLLENLLQFPSDVLLPFTGLNRTRIVWEWNFLGKEPEQINSELPMSDTIAKELDVVHALEEKFAAQKSFETKTDIQDEEYPTQEDWDILHKIEKNIEHEMQEMKELEDRMEKPLESWVKIFKSAQKARKFESYERDEGEMYRTGQPLCIYEIYDGAYMWPFLHSGSLFRGLSLSTRALRSTSDDVNAVSRLGLLSNAHYKDSLCELGGMFAIANKVDNVHSMPWIGFQSWRATAKKVSLSKEAERVLEETIRAETEDTIYYWARLELNRAGRKNNLSFWSLCEILNANYCRSVFEDAFRHMYSLPVEFDHAFPLIPEHALGHWAGLHSWIMPTPSFLEFIMFSRMFVDSLDSLIFANETYCMLRISTPARKHYFCRMLELLVNVWAYNSGRKMIYVDPTIGTLEEQHPFEDRKMNENFFNFTLLKSMDSDLAEAAYDNYYPRKKWLWPHTGEVYNQEIYDREMMKHREEREEKRRKQKLRRAKHVHKQKSLGKEGKKKGGKFRGNVTNVTGAP